MIQTDVVTGRLGKEKRIKSMKNLRHNQWMVARCKKLSVEASTAAVPPPSSPGVVVRRVVAVHKNRKERTMSTQTKRNAYGSLQHYKTHLSPKHPQHPSSSPQHPLLRRRPPRTSCTMRCREDGSVYTIGAAYAGCVYCW